MLTKIIGVVKAVLYLGSVVLPMLDMCKGVKSGIKKAYRDEQYAKEAKDVFHFVDVETEVNEEVEE